MSILDVVQRQPTADDGARQVRQVFQHSFRQMEMSLRQVSDIVTRFGRANVEGALGADAKQLAGLYAAIKATVETNKSDVTIPELPG